MKGNAGIIQGRRNIRFDLAEAVLDDPFQRQTRQPN